MQSAEWVARDAAERQASEERAARDAAERHCSHLRALGHALAMLVHVAQVILCIGMSLVGRLSVPRCSLLRAE